jgi:hypothetical protein
MWYFCDPFRFEIAAHLQEYDASLSITVKSHSTDIDEVFKKAKNRMHIEAYVF